MPDPVMLAIAAAVAGQVGEAGVDAVRASWHALVRLIRDRLSGDHAGAAALVTAVEDPTDPRRVEALAVALATAGLADRSFRQQLLELWHQVEPGLPSGTTVVNTVSHSTVAGGMIQAGTVVLGGDVSFGQPSNRHVRGGSEYP